MDAIAATRKDVGTCPAHLFLGIAKHHPRNELLQLRLRRYMQLHYGVGRICAHATYTSGVAFQSSFSIVKLAISETRMKAETLSWSMWLATAQTRFGPQDMAKIGIIIGLPKKTEKKCRREVGNDFSLAYHKVQMPFGRSRFKRFNFWSSESRMKFPSILPKAAIK